MSNFFSYFLNLTFCKRNNVKIILLIIFVFSLLYYYFSSVSNNNFTKRKNIYKYIWTYISYIIIHIYLYMFIYIYIYSYIKICLPSLVNYIFVPKFFNNNFLLIFNIEILTLIKYKLNF